MYLQVLVSGIASLQGAGRQIGVLVFELAVEGEPPFIFVVGQEGCQSEHLAERETRAHWASLSDIWTHNQHKCQCASRADRNREINRAVSVKFVHKLES